MTHCPTDDGWIRFLGGHLGEDERSLLQAHLAACSACSERYRALAGTWDLLGAWDVQAPPRDLLTDIMSHLQPDSRWARVGGRLRVAAAVALAAGLGTAAGLLTPLGRSSPPPRVVSTEELVEHIGLAEIAGGSSMLGGLFNPDDAALSEDAP